MLLAVALLAAGCSASSRGQSQASRPRAKPSQPSPPPAPPVVAYQTRPAKSAPTVTGAGSLGPVLAAERPTLQPASAGPALQGKALPTNTWWTSALIGNYTSALWAFPVVATGAADGLELSAPEPSASQNSVVASAAPALTVGGPLKGVTVTGYGDFSVDLSLQGADTTLTTIIAQGSPFVPVRAPAGTLPIALAAATSVSDGQGKDLAVGRERRQRHACRAIAGPDVGARGS